MKSKRTKSALFAASFAVLGVLALTLLSAGSPQLVFEAESAQQAGPILTKQDAGASGGKYLEFSEASSSVSAKPNASNTGPRTAPTRTITSDQAMTELRETGYLSGVRIKGSLVFQGSDGVDWVIEDSIIETTGAYGVHAYISKKAFTGTYDQRPILRYVDIIGKAPLGTGSSSASLVGGNIVVEHADIYGSQDAVKGWDNLSLRYSWLHDMDHPSGAHCDTLQVRSGVNMEYTGNRFDAYVGYSSDGTGGLGETCSGGLQTGSGLGDLSATFTGNWFAGGHITIRGFQDVDGYIQDYKFRDNKWMAQGTSVALGKTNLPPNKYGPTSGDLGDFDASNVWEHTGEPVR